MAQVHKDAGMVFRNGKVMIVKEEKLPFWLSPGGKRNPGESCGECLDREIMEELSCRVKSREFWKTFHGTTPKGDPLELDAWFVELDGDAKPSSEVNAIAWIDSTYSKDEYLLAPTLGERIIGELLKEKRIN
ncbi:MAG TPA: NUDIX domain-containing protein [archaeon]|nr:NUDIX domain-containing protein [archaeon]HLD80856.1 NUDIX domain-containing protein [archaeon]